MAITIRLGAASKVGKFSYAWKGKGAVVRYPYVQDLDGDGVDEVIFAGFGVPKGPGKYDTFTQVQVFGWQNGRFANITRTLIPTGQERVQGVGEVRFGDFDGDGRADVFLSGYADTDFTLNAYALMNRGGRLERVDLGPCDGLQHGVTARDINRDGYTDVVASGYSEGSHRVYLGGPDGLVSHDFSLAGAWPGGSGVDAADFLGNGGMQVIVVDHGASNLPDFTEARDTTLLSLSFGANGLTPVLSEEATLPLPILEQPRFGNFTRGHYDNSHDVRVFAHDLDGDPLPDAIVLSVGGFDGRDWVNKGAVQLLRNFGGGRFEDVTSQMLRGFTNDAQVGYSPVFRDFNGDGLTDIYLGEQNRHTANSGFFLFGDPGGGFTESGRAMLTKTVGNAISTVARGPNGKHYLVWDGGSQDLPTGHISMAQISFSGSSDRPAPATLLDLEPLHSDVGLVGVAAAM